MRGLKFTSSFLVFTALLTVITTAVFAADISPYSEPSANALEAIKTAVSQGRSNPQISKILAMYQSPYFNTFVNGSSSGPGDQSLSKRRFASQNIVLQRQMLGKAGYKFQDNDYRDVHAIILGFDAQWEVPGFMSEVLFLVLRSDMTSIADIKISDLYIGQTGSLYGSSDLLKYLELSNNMVSAAYRLKNPPSPTSREIWQAQEKLAAEERAEREEHDVQEIGPDEDLYQCGETWN